MFWLAIGSYQVRLSECLCFQELGQDLGQDLINTILSAEKRRLLLYQPNCRLVCRVRAGILIYRVIKSDTAAGVSTATMADSAQDIRGLFIQSASRVSCFGRNVACSGRDGKLLHIHQSGANLCQANS